MPSDFSLRLILPELIVTGTGLLLLAADLWVQDKRRLGRVGLGGLIIALLSVLLIFGETGEIWSRAVTVDGFSNFFRVIFLVVSGLVILSSADYLEERRIPVGEFYMLVIFATLGMMLMASSVNLLTIYLGLEILSLASYALTGMLRDDDRSAEAAVKYVLIGGITSAIIVFGMSIVYGVTGSLHLGDVAAVLASGNSAAPAALLAGIVFLIAGFGVKIAAVPFHMWAPDIYQGAPTPVSAFLITASEGAAFAALIRIFLVGFPLLGDHWSTLFAVLAVITMTLGNVAAITQTNVKRMMAYSAIAQAGYVLVGLAVATPAAISAMLYYLFAYSFMTIGAFVVIILLNNNEGAELISDFSGLSRRSPWFAFALAVYMLSLVGTPPTAGFFGKFYLFQAAVSSGMTWLAIVMVVNSAASIPYYFSLIRHMYLVEAPDPTPVPSTSPLRWAMGITLVATLILGLFPEKLVFWVNQVTTHAELGLAMLGMR